MSRALADLRAGLPLPEHAMPPELFGDGCAAGNDLVDEEISACVRRFRHALDASMLVGAL